MSLRVRITRDDISPKLRNVVSDLAGPARRRLLLAMARKFASITKQNFGKVGFDRPAPWKELNPNYAKWKKRKGARPVADLLLTKNLYRSIRAECNSEQFSTVTAYNPYAAAHQFGVRSRNLPPRPFMPIAGAQVTSKTRAALLKVAEEELTRLLKK